MVEPAAVNRVVVGSSPTGTATEKQKFRLSTNGRLANLKALKSN